MFGIILRVLLKSKQTIKVGEHIPGEYEKVFLENIHRLNTIGVVISWANIGKTFIKEFI